MSDRAPSDVYGEELEELLTDREETR